VCLQESLHGFRRVADCLGIASSLAQLSITTRAQGDIGGARSYAEEALSVAREVGNPGLTTLALACLSASARDGGDLGLARRYATESVALASDAGMQRRLAESLAVLASITVRSAPPVRGNRPCEVDDAVRLWSAAHALRTRTGLELEPFERARYETDLDDARRRLGPARFGAAWVAGQTMPITASMDEQRVSSSGSVGG
jgi:hypothetical protein